MYSLYEIVRGLFGISPIIGSIAFCIWDNIQLAKKRKDLKEEAERNGWITFAKIVYERQDRNSEPYRTHIKFEYKVNNKTYHLRRTYNGIKGCGPNNYHEVYYDAFNPKHAVMANDQPYEKIRFLPSFLLFIILMTILAFIVR